uniref:Uncharacterized protein n=1 Tax=Rhizophora mucronata TaxID=61149 RepID=A0A2P2PZ15_RHIMU
MRSSVGRPKNMCYHFNLSLKMKRFSVPFSPFLLSVCDRVALSHCRWFTLYITYIPCHCFFL